MTLIISFFPIVVQVDFESPMYTFSEADGVSTGISLMLSTAIAQPLTVTVMGGTLVYNSKLALLIFHLNMRFC